MDRLIATSLNEVTKTLGTSWRTSPPLPSRFPQLKRKREAPQSRATGPEKSNEAEKILSDSRQDEPAEPVVVDSQPVQSGHRRYLDPMIEIESESVSKSSILRTPKIDRICFSKILEGISSRGRGQYTCPLGKDCAKGGLDIGGEPLVFELNSTFR